MNITIKYGIIAGISTIVFYLLFYFNQKQLIFLPSVIWSSVAIGCVFMFFLGKKFFDENNEFPFVLKNIFIVWIIIEVMFYIWYYRFYNADPMLAKLQSDVMIENYKYLMTQTQEMDQIKSLRNEINYLQQNLLTFTIKEALMGLARGLIGGFILSYLITLILDRTQRKFNQ